MKMHYRTPSGRISFEIDVPTGKAAFETAAAVAELFEEPSCGCCGQTNIRHDVREFDANKYYKIVCADCGAQLDFGQNKDGVHLFAKRFDKDTKRPLANRGWYVYQGGSKPAAPQRNSGRAPSSDSDSPY